jgi:hypothetical protein
LLIGPLAGYVGRKRDERNDKQKCRYKKQLFGHIKLGVASSRLVTSWTPLERRNTREIELSD